MRPPYLPMLAKDAPAKDAPLPTGSGFVMEPKLDGWRWMVQVGNHGVVRSWSGRNGVERSLPVVEAELAWLPADTVLDGELIVRGTGGATGMMGSTAVGSVLAHGGELTLVVFDVLRLAGIEVLRDPWENRRPYIDQMARRFDGKLVRVSKPEPVDRLRYEQWLGDGLEGCIVKRIAAPYTPSRRSDAFVKYKPQQTDEAVVLGFVGGKGSLAGDVGAFEIRLLRNGALTTVGINNEVRAELREAGPEAYLGKVIEFAHHGLREDSGKPRHPVWRGRREDR